MKLTSKHFMSDGHDGVVLDPADWTEEQFDAFKKIFGLEKAERIVISEYKIEAYDKPELTETDWVFAYDHLNLAIAEYMMSGPRGIIWAKQLLLPMKMRYDLGERSRDLYDAIMRLD